MRLAGIPRKIMRHSLLVALLLSWIDKTALFTKGSDCFPAENMKFPHIMAGIDPGDPNQEQEGIEYQTITGDNDGTFLLSGGRVYDTGLQMNPGLNE